MINLLSIAFAGNSRLENQAPGRRRSLSSSLATSTALASLFVASAFGVSTAAAQSTMPQTAADWLASPQFTGINWGLAAIDAAPAFARGYSGSNVGIGVIDSGINTAHNAFQYNLLTAVAQSLIPNSALTDIADTDGHGTHVAGIVAAPYSIDSRMMGVAYNAKMLVSLESSSVDAMKYIYDLNNKYLNNNKSLLVSLINASYGPPFGELVSTGGSTQTFSINSAVMYNNVWNIPKTDIDEGKALRALVGQGVVAVNAAGNYRQELIDPTKNDMNTSYGILANNPTGIGMLPYVTPAHTAEGIYYHLASDVDKQTDFSDLLGKVVVVVNVKKGSQDGKYIISDDSIRCGFTATWCIAAPGDNILSTFIRGNTAYRTLSGTSMATPFVTGAFAVVKEVFPDLSAESLVTTVLTTADRGALQMPSDTTDFGAVYGQGLLDLGKAVNGPARFDKIFDARVDTKSAVFANDIAGPGGLIKTGRESLTLSGADTYTGGTTVAEGRLAVNGSITSDVQVNAGATLGGAGIVKGRAVIDGVLSPGNSIGTLTINGDLRVNNSASVVIQMGNGGIDVVDVGGKTSLNGEVRFEEISGMKVTTSTQRFLRSANGVTGVFSANKGAMPFLKESLIYRPTEVDAAIIRDFRFPVATANQNAVATSLNRTYKLGDQGDLDSVFTALDAVGTDAAARDALDQLSGASLSDAVTGTLVTRGLFARTVEDRLAQRRAPDGPIAAADARVGGLSAGEAPSKLTGWARPLGGFGRIGGEGAAGGFNQRIAGVMTGLDTAIGDNAVLGAALGYANTLQVSGNSGNRSITDHYQIAVYGDWQSGSLFADGQIGYTYASTNSSRVLAFGGLNRKAGGTADGHDLTMAVKAGIHRNVAGVEVEPSIGLDWYRVARTGFTESNAGSAGLQVADQVVNAIKPSLGARASVQFQYGDDVRLIPEMRARWYHDLGDGKAPVTARLIGAPAAGFTTTGAVVGRDSAVIGTGLSAVIDDSLRLNVGYEAELAKGQTSHAFTAGIKYSW